MKKFFKVILTTLFWQALFFLTIFYVPYEDYYAQWLIGYLIFFIIVLIISIKVIPSKKEEEYFKKMTEEYKNILKLEDEIRAESLKLELTCPACEKKSPFWSYLDDYKCNKCGSDLWTTVLNKQDEAYDKIFKKREKTNAFYNKLRPGQKRKLHRLKF